MKVLEALNKKANKKNFYREIEVEGNKIRIKQYLPYTEKIVLANTAISQGLEHTNSYSRVVTDFATKLGIVKTYAGIDYSGVNLVEAYDLLMQSGLYNKVVRAIPAWEFAELKTVIDKQEEDTIRQIEDSKSISGALESLRDILSEVSNSISLISEDGKLESYMTELKEQLEDLSPEKLEYVNSFLKQVVK